MEQWIPVGIAAAAFLLIGGIALYKHLRTDYPEGKLIKMRWGKYRVNLIQHPRSRVETRLGVSCLNAVKAIVSAHNTLQRSGVDVAGSVAPIKKYFKEFSVLILPQYMLLGQTEAYITVIDGIPTCVVSDSCMSGVVATGEPVISMACHVVLRDYKGPRVSSIWRAAANNKSLQAVARSVYLELSRTLQAR